MSLFPFRNRTLRPVAPRRRYSPAQYITLSFALAILLGTLLLWLPWSHAPGQGISPLQALFTATSAVCVTGLVVVDTGTAWSPIGQAVIMLLIKMGGLGLVTLGTLLAIILGRHIGFNERMRLATQVSALHTGGVVRLIRNIFLFTVAVEALGLAFEWTNPRTLGALPPGTRLLVGFFQSVTPRTAGFNSVDYSQLHHATLLFTMLMMFVGASPGSTGGGIKTVPFFILVGSAWSLFQGRDELVAFGRGIDLKTVVKAGIIMLVAMLITGAALTALCLTDPDQAFLDLAFETMSAFGTVGLSTGITAEISPLGQVVLMTLMYLGRLGPLLFALALLEQRQQTNLKYPSEGVLMG